MNLLTIPLRYSRRKPLKALLLVAVFGLGVTAVAALNNVSQVIDRSLEQKLTAFGANILIMPKTESLNVSYGGFNLGNIFYETPTLSEAEVDRAVKSIELHQRIAGYGPKLAVAKRINSMPTAVVGVRFAQELSMKNYWVVKGAYPGKAQEILLGSAAAERLQTEPGKTLRIEDADFTVSGVLQPTGSDEDNAVFMDLATLQGLENTPNTLTFAEVSALCAGCPIQDIADQLSAAMPYAEVKPLQNVVKQRMFAVNFVKRLVLAVSVVILITACTMLALSMLSAVNERTQEIGLLRAVGWSTRGIFSIFCFDGLIIGLVSGVVGYTAGYFLSLRIVEALLPDTPAAVAFNLAQAAAGCLLIAIIAAGASLFPARKAARIDPSQALTGL